MRTSLKCPNLTFFSGCPYPVLANLVFVKTIEVGILMCVVNAFLRPLKSCFVYINISSGYFKSS